MKVVITGASGFVGRAVVQQAEAQRLGVVPVGRATVRYDDPASLAAAIVGSDAVIHLAGPAHSKVGGADRSGYLHDIRDASVNLWRAAELAGCRRFVYASSIKVYGEATACPASESTPCRPASVYGEAKLEAEAALLGLSRDSKMKLTILRFPPIYGPGMRGSVRHLFRAARWWLPLPVHGFVNRRSLLYVENAAKVLVAAATGAIDRELYVVHEPEAWTIGELYSGIYQAVNGRSLPTAWRWRLPRFLSAVLGRIHALAPLVAPFHLDSQFSADLQRHFSGTSREWLAATASKDGQRRWK